MHVRNATEQIMNEHYSLISWNGVKKRTVVIVIVRDEVHQRLIGQIIIMIALMINVCKVFIQHPTPMYLRSFSILILDACSSMKVRRTGSSSSAHCPHQYAICNAQIDFVGLLATMGKLQDKLID